MKSSETVATIAETVVGLGIIVGVVTLAIVRPEALPDTVVINQPKPTVVVKQPVIQPYVVNAPGVIRLPHTYQTHYNYVMYQGTKCYLRHNLDGSWCYVTSNGYQHPVVWC